VRRLPRHLEFMLALAAAFPSAARAQVPAVLHGRHGIVVVEGATSLELLPDGRPDLVVSGWYENFNAHGFHFITFYVQYPDSESGQTRWAIVPFVDGSRTTNAFSTIQGADCVIRDLRLYPALAEPRAPAVAVVAEREFGRSYADSGVVTFSVYQLHISTTFTPGKPAIAYVRTTRFTSHRRYCDVGEAFSRELGVQ
jgi:hypothetical protein